MPPTNMAAVRVTTSQRYNIFSEMGTVSIACKLFYFLSTEHYFNSTELNPECILSVLCVVYVARKVFLHKYIKTDFSKFSDYHRSAFGVMFTRCLVLKKGIITVRL